MSNNKLDLGGQKLGAKLDGNKLGANVGTGNRATAKVGADNYAEVEGNRAGASVMDKVDMDSDTEQGGSKLIEDEYTSTSSSTKRLQNGTSKNGTSKGEKSGDSSGNKLIDWKIDFDAAGGSLKDEKEEIDHVEDESYEENDKRNAGTVSNRERRHSSLATKSSGPSKSIITFRHDEYGTVWPIDTYRSFRDLGMGMILAFVAMFAIHFSLSYRTMGSWIPDPRLPIKLKKRKLS